MILVTGGTGQVGTAVRVLIDGVISPDRAALDLSRPAGLDAALESIGPTAIINCAAYTAVDDAEDEFDLASTVNGTAVGVMAAYAADRGIPFVTFSSDYVFDGLAADPYVESSPTNPINAYGRSKELGERAALARCPNALVVRSSWVVSATHPNFVTRIVERATAGPVNVVFDQVGCPTFAPDLARATLAALSAGTTGILHLTNTGATSWFELARAACATAGVNPERVRPIATDEYPTRARRPRYSVLGSERRDGLRIGPLPPWQAALDQIVGPRRRA